MRVVERYYICILLIIPTSYYLLLTTYYLLHIFTSHVYPLLYSCHLLCLLLNPLKLLNHSIGPSYAPIQGRILVMP